MGRLAPEKQVEDLAILQGVPGVRLAVVGDGSSRSKLQALLPQALFLGHLDGDALAEAMASFDAFVHPGESETFGQTLQEAHASGVPVVATGRGAPLDLVRMGIDGWLYRPGDLEDLRMRVADLAGDARKRRALGEAGREGVQGRSWASICDQLLERFEEARMLQRVDVSLRARREVRPEKQDAVEQVPWRRYVALGDSLTEGLAIRSKRVSDVCGAQLERALQLRPDLVSILIGANDLVKPWVKVRAIASQLEEAVVRLRAVGRRHALPWVWRRMHGRAAGDGRVAKHDDYVYLGRSSAQKGVTVR